MPGFGKFNVKDIDNRWFIFDQQQKGMSCGPTCVKIAKELYHNKVISEEAIRGSVTLQQNPYALNQGMSLVEAANDPVAEATWDFGGSGEKVILLALKAKPLSIPNASYKTGIKELRQATRTKPAIIGFGWSGGGGHFVVCVGPTKLDPSLFVILDPDGGLQYLSADDTIGNAFGYRPSYGQVGIADFSKGFIATW